MSKGTPASVMYQHHLSKCVTFSNDTVKVIQALLQGNWCPQLRAQVEAKIL